MSFHNAIDELSERIYYHVDSQTITEEHTTGLFEGFFSCHSIPNLSKLKQENHQEAITLLHLHLSVKSSTVRILLPWCKVTHTGLQ